jgi:hypothetical protein
MPQTDQIETEVQSETDVPALLPSFPSVEQSEPLCLGALVVDPSVEIDRLRAIITRANAELQYAHVSNCPMHWLKVAQTILAEADQKPSE